jgi:hypothetical protein
MLSSWLVLFACAESILGFWAKSVAVICNCLVLVTLSWLDNCSMTCVKATFVILLFQSADLSDGKSDLL